MKKLMNVVSNMAALNIPSCQQLDDGKLVGHWSGTKATMEETLSRRLTPTEITALSLSRNFGPLPHNNSAVTSFQAFLWPKGNNNSYWYDWDELYEQMIIWLELQE